MLQTRLKKVCAMNQWNGNGENQWNGRQGGNQWNGGNGGMDSRPGNLWFTAAQEAQQANTVGNSQRNSSAGMTAGRSGHGPQNQANQAFFAYEDVFQSTLPLLVAPHRIINHVIRTPSMLQYNQGYPPNGQGPPMVQKTSPLLQPTLKRARQEDFSDANQHWPSPYNRPASGGSFQKSVSCASSAQSSLDSNMKSMQGTTKQVRSYPAAGVRSPNLGSDMGFGFEGEAEELHVGSGICCLLAPRDDSQAAMEALDEAFGTAEALLLAVALAHTHRSQPFNASHRQAS